MDETSEAGTAAYEGRKATIETACAAMRLSAKAMGESPTFGDLMIFEWARQAEMSPSGRASEFLDHFLFGNGQTKSFETANLLNEDLGVRRRISDVITEKLRSNPALRTKRKTISGGDYVVAVRQGDFTAKDWQYALGAFVFEWELVGSRTSTQKLFARVWGRNEYKWHPLAERVTKCVHEAGVRLTKSTEIHAKNFIMEATPAVIVLQTGKPVDSW